MGVAVRVMCVRCCAQVYLLLSCCPCEGRLSGIVDVPNACATLAIPTAIFDQVALYPAHGSLPL